MGIRTHAKDRAMAQREYSEYQQRIISKYYDQLDTILLHKLQELVSQIYLSDTEAKRNRLWQRVHKAMVQLRIPPEIVEHIMTQKDVETLTRNLQDWLSHSNRRE
jgi:hypothetical protein